MKLKPLLELSKCRIREFMREPSAFFWVIFMPILWMVILGYALSRDSMPEIAVGLVKTEVQSPVLASLHELKQLRLYEGERGALEQRMQRGDLVLLISFDAAQTPQFIYDPKNPEAAMARTLIEDAWQRKMGRQDVFAVSTEAYHVKGGRYVDFLIPGLLGMSILSTSFFGIGMVMVSNRRENLFKRYRTTPMQFRTFMLSHIFGRCFSLVVETAAILIAGYLLFNFSFQGSAFFLALLLILGAAATTAIAMLIASRSKSVPAVSGLLNLVMIPMVILSGVFFPKKYFPDWLQQAAEWLPLSMINDGLRSLSTTSSSFSELAFPMLGLLAYAVVFSLGTWKLFRWE